MFRTPSPSSSEKTVPRRTEGESNYILVCNKRSRQSEHQRSDFKLRNLVFCVWEDTSFWAQWIRSLPMHLCSGGGGGGGVWGGGSTNPVLLFTLKSGRWLLLAFPQLLSNHGRGLTASVGCQFWEPSFTFGGQKSTMAMIFPVYCYGRRYFHFTALSNLLPSLMLMD